MTQLSCHKCGCPLADPSLRVPFILIGKHHFCSRTCVEAWLADLPDAFEIVGDLLITITETLIDWAGLIAPALGRPQSPALSDPVSSGVFSDVSPLREPQGAPQHMGDISIIALLVGNSHAPARHPETVIIGESFIPDRCPYCNNSLGGSDYCAECRALFIISPSVSR